MSTAHVPLLDVAIQRGLVGGPFGSSLGQKDYVQSGVPVIRGTNLGFGRALGGEYVFVSEDKVRDDLARNTAEPGDLVFTQRGTLGQVALVPDTAFAQYVVSQSQMRLRVNPLIASAEYLYYACSSSQFLKQIDDNAISTGVPHINLGILSRLSVPLPELPVQQAIAEVLGALDDKIAANAKLVATAAELALLLASRFTSSVPLGEVAVHRKKSTSPETLDVPKVAHFSLPAFDAGELPELSSPTGIKSSKFLIENPSVLISKLNPRSPRVWNVAEVPQIPALSSTEFLVLESPFTTTAVLWSLLRQDTFGAQLESKVAGTSGSHQRVKPADLLATLIADPRMIDQSSTAKITSLGEVSTRTRLENQALAATRDTLLPQLISGKLRVKDAEAALKTAGV